MTTLKDPFRNGFVPPQNALPIDLRFDISFRPLIASMKAVSVLVGFGYKLKQINLPLIKWPTTHLEWMGKIIPAKFLHKYHIIVGHKPSLEAAITVVLSNLAPITLDLPSIKRSLSDKGRC